MVQEVSGLCMKSQLQLELDLGVGTLFYIKVEHEMLISKHFYLNP